MCAQHSCMFKIRGENQDKQRKERGNICSSLSEGCLFMSRADRTERHSRVLETSGPPTHQIIEEDKSQAPAPKQNIFLTV